MLKNVLIKKVLFMDIETVPKASSFEELDERFQELWVKKAEKKYHDTGLSDENTFLEFAALYSEFCQIVCISVGIFDQETFRTKSFFGTDEREILKEFSEMALKMSDGGYYCAHNGMNFDFPFIAKRCIINKLPIPWMFDAYGKKPWEMGYLIDTLKLWQGMSWGGGGTLDELTAVFDIPSPKTDMNGSEVKDYYYMDKHFEIAKYCEQDVVALARVFQSFKLEQVVKKSNIVSKTKKDDAKL